MVEDLEKTAGHYLRDIGETYFKIIDRVGDYLLKKYESQEEFRLFLRSGLIVAKDIWKIPINKSEDK